jgi:hypothetical protein
MQAETSQAVATAFMNSSREGVATTPAINATTSKAPPTVIDSSEGRPRIAEATAASATHNATGNRGARQPRKASSKAVHNALASHGWMDDDGPPAKGLTQG